MRKSRSCFAAAYRENNSGEPMPGVCFPPPYRFASDAWRANGEAGEALMILVDDMAANAGRD